MTIRERERILTDVARRYLRGEMSYEVMTRIRRALRAAQSRTEG